MKCGRCGRELQDGSQLCNYCGLSQDSPEATIIALKRQIAVNKRRKRILVAVILVVAFVVWKSLSPKTVESGDGWKHQIGDFKEECEFSDFGDCTSATHRIQHFFGTYGYYCDECWETYGQEYFDKLAEKESNKRDSSEAKDAKICAVKAVEDNLKSPSTAEFCPYPEMTATSLGGNKWKVTGYVDAQNSFGVMLRKNWTVTLTLTSSGFKDATVIIN